MSPVLTLPKEPPAFSAWLARREKKRSPTDLLPLVPFAAFSEVLRLRAASHAHSAVQAARRPARDYGMWKNAGASMLGDVEAVMNNLGLRHLGFGCRLERRAHVHDHGFNLLTLFKRQALEERLGAGSCRPSLRIIWERPNAIHLLCQKISPPELRPC
jgi:hypothetical protein